MLKKLLGLLVFSQAAERIARVDHKNYRESFCDESLFKAISAQEVGSHVSSEDAARVKGYHDRYCTVRGWYEKAVRDDTDSLDKSKHSCAIAPELGNFINRASCTVITGMEYASVCDQARDFKNDPDNRNGWNAVMSKIKPCKP